MALRIPRAPPLSADGDHLRLCRAPDAPRSTQGYEHGAVDYLTAPIIPELLRAKVRVFAELYRKTVALQREMAGSGSVWNAKPSAPSILRCSVVSRPESHEIRNPLAALFLHVDVLEEELQQPTPESAADDPGFAEIRTQLARLPRTSCKIT